MALQLHIDDRLKGYWFVDTDRGGVQVGEATERPDGSWEVLVNDTTLTAPDLDSAIRLFVEKYDRSLLHLSPMSDEGNWPDSGVSEGGIRIIDL